MNFQPDNLSFCKSRHTYTHLLIADIGDIIELENKNQTEDMK